MKHTSRLLLAATILSFSLPAFAQYRDKMEPYPYAQGEEEAQKPLMVIRFNQNNVYYQLPLYNAVQKALQVKPNAQFTFVSKVPFTGQPQKDQRFEQEARANWQNVLQTVTDIGLPEKQMEVRFEKSNQLLTNEILVFVR